MGARLVLKLNQVDLLFWCTNVANKICEMFCMEEVFKCRERRMIWEDEEWTNSQACGCPCHPKKYPKGTSIKAWGCPRHLLLHQQKYQVIFQDTIFLLLHMICVILGASVILDFSLFCFVWCSLWLYPSIFCLERDTLCFHCLEHSSFHSYCSASVHFLLVLRLALVFHSYFVQSLLVCFSFIWLALGSLMIIIYESCFKQVDWCWRRVKYFMLIVVQWECLMCA